RGLRPGGLSQPPEPVYQRTSGGPYPARGPAAEPHAGEGSPADPQDRQAPGVLLRVLFLQEVGQCGQLPLLHRFQLSGPGPDRGADPGHGGPQGASDPQPHGGGSHPSPDVSAAKHGGT
ncbi:putative membrane transporter protein, partial [Dysosmobacter welbionis]